MRAWQVTDSGDPTEVLRLTDAEVPEPGPGQARIRVHAAAVGFPDLAMCQGTYPLTPGHPFTPGQEVAGTVAAVGPGVDDALIGRRVMAVTAFYLGQGGFAEETVASVDNTFSAPALMSDADAAAFTIPFHTAWIGLRTRAHIQAGESMLVLGAAGGSGSAAVTLGRALGARVIAVAGGESKANFCRHLGAHEVVDHSAQNVSAAVLALTDNAGADVIFDPVGGQPANDALKAIANEGRHLLIGFASGAWAEPPISHVVQRNYSLVGVYAGAYNRSFNEGLHHELLSLFDRGDLTSIVTGTAHMEQLPEVLSHLADRSAIGKTVLITDEDRRPIPSPRQAGS